MQTYPNDTDKPIFANGGPRPISQVAREIHKLWVKPYFGAVPYIAAMQYVDGIDDMYGLDTAGSLIIYFLANANTWRGPDARRIKSELKQIAGLK